LDSFSLLPLEVVREELQGLKACCTKLGFNEPADHSMYVSLWTVMDRAEGDVIASTWASRVRNWSSSDTGRVKLLKVLLGGATSGGAASTGEMASAVTAASSATADVAYDVEEHKHDLTAHFARLEAFAAANGMSAQPTRVIADAMAMHDQAELEKAMARQGANSVATAGARASAPIASSSSAAVAPTSSSSAAAAVEVASDGCGLVVILKTDLSVPV
jgi:hypothetical protein